MRVDVGKGGFAVEVEVGLVDHADGVRRGMDAIPKDIASLTDDPYRSLAGELRREGGYSKETTPFSEFIWADFLRRRIKPSAVEKDFKRAMTRALVLAKRPEAAHLPGWCGPVADN